ncbi:hypothetical protein N7446_010236 [Penicillium canescens]|nr:hypothetical protein N7446_010236 [Penicillium canescens]
MESKLELGSYGCETSIRRSAGVPEAAGRLVILDIKEGTEVLATLVSKAPEIGCVEETKTYNSKDSLVVTHLTTNLPACGLSTAERTGSPVLHTLWSYVPVIVLKGTRYSSFRMLMTGFPGPRPLPQSRLRTLQ